MSKSPKVFGIGFHKTGTSSLGLALEHLGYKVGGPNGVRDPLMGQDYACQMAFQLVEEGQYDAFKDNPWGIIYRELDERYPNSKFILTTRPTEDWINSAVRHFDTQSTPMRQWIYGVGYPKGNETTYITRYERHNAEVITYFQDKANALLVLNLAEEEGWPKLCRFLNKPIPDIPFPHANKNRFVGDGRRKNWASKI